MTPPIDRVAIPIFQIDSTSSDSQRHEKKIVTPSESPKGSQLAKGAQKSVRPSAAAADHSLGGVVLLGVLGFLGGLGLGRGAPLGRGAGRGAGRARRGGRGRGAAPDVLQALDPLLLGDGLVSVERPADYAQHHLQLVRLVLQGVVMQDVEADFARYFVQADQVFALEHLLQHVFLGNRESISADV